MVADALSWLFAYTLHTNDTVVVDFRAMVEAQVIDLTSS